MLEFLFDNIFVLFGGRVFQQTVGITISTDFLLFVPSRFQAGTSHEKQKEASLIM